MLKLSYFSVLCKVKSPQKSCGTCGQFLSFFLWYRVKKSKICSTSKKSYHIAGILQLLKPINLLKFILRSYRQQTIKHLKDSVAQRTIQTKPDCVLGRVLLYMLANVQSLAQLEQLNCPPAALQPRPVWTMSGHSQLAVRTHQIGRYRIVCWKYTLVLTL